jgi:putative transcriptional regulator
MSTAGRLLVATPTLLDPNFERAVVLMLEHSEQGALGVVLNRPSGLPVADVLASWAPLVTPPSMVFEGGPVSTDSALGLVRTRERDVLGIRRLEHGVRLVDLDTPAELVGGSLTAMRLFAGYSGWAAGQLEDELDEDAWFVVDALPDDAFSADPQNLWRRVLRRQPPPLSMVASFPQDPALN